MCFFDWDYNADAGAVTINASLIPDKRNTCGSLFPSLSLDLPLSPLRTLSNLFLFECDLHIFFLKKRIAAEITERVYVTDVKSSFTLGLRNIVRGASWLQNIGPSSFF